MSDHKCGGACCRRFILPSPPEVLRNQYQAWLIGSRTRYSEIGLHKAAKQDSEDKYGFMHRELEVGPEIHLIYPMLIYLGECNFDPCAPRKKTKYKSHHYTCKHFDKKTSLCTIYDIRPMMCRQYPNGEPCLFPNCKIKGNATKLKKAQERGKKKLIDEDAAIEVKED